ncbi:MAG: hypothetical protein U9O98_05970 [Asgard group archaeon]|nr:hypothetical protein [Asgard group archaeon]
MKETYRKLAVSFFNEIWKNIEKGNERTALENEMMLGYAHSSRLLWGLVGKDIHFQRGEWLLSHVYALLNRSEPALHHAKQCWFWTEKNDFKDFDLAFAYECLARASACEGAKQDFQEYYTKAQEAGEQITKKEDREYFLSELKKGPWFNLQ